MALRPPRDGSSRSLSPAAGFKAALNGFGPPRWPDVLTPRILPRRPPDVGVGGHDHACACSPPLPSPASRSIASSPCEASRCWAMSPGMASAHAAEQVLRETKEEVEAADRRRAAEGQLASWSVRARQAPQAPHPAQGPAILLEVMVAEPPRQRGCECHG